MSASVARAAPDEGTPWPQVGKVSGNSVGTGFVVGKRLVLTALHVVEGARELTFELGGGIYPATLVQRVPDIDTALLQVDEVPGLPPPPEPLLLCSVPLLPIPFATWGYRQLGDGQLRLLLGFGRIEARPQPALLQLSTRTQRPGMSGAPVAIRVKQGWKVVALGCARHYPEDFREDESLALAHPVSALPEEILAELGGAAVPEPIQPLNRSLPLSVPIVQQLEESASRHDRAARFWRLFCGGSVAGMMVLAGLGLAEIISVPVIFIVLVCLVTASTFGLVLAREERADAVRDRSRATALRFIDTEADSPNQLGSILPQKDAT